MDLVRSGKRVRIDRRSVAAVLAGELLEKAPPAVAVLPVAARLHPGAEAVQAPGGLGLILDDRRLWRVPDAGVLAANGSAAHPATAEQWNTYPRGSLLG
jgi:hypothetical protein